MELAATDRFAKVYNLQIPDYDVGDFQALRYAVVNEIVRLLNQPCAMNWKVLPKSRILVQIDSISSDRLWWSVSKYILMRLMWNDIDRLILQVYICIDIIDETPFKQLMLRVAAASFLVAFFLLGDAVRWPMILGFEAGPHILMVSHLFSR